MLWLHSSGTKDTSANIFNLPKSKILDENMEGRTKTDPTPKNPTAHMATMGSVRTMASVDNGFSGASA